MRNESADRRVVIATKDAVSCEFGSGVALLDLKSNVYFSLNGVGTYIWELIQKPMPVSGVYEAVLARYAVDPDRCRGDVDRLLKSLEEAGLVRLRHEEIA